MDLNDKLTAAIIKLTEFKNGINTSNLVQFKKGENYLNWVTMKTKLIIDEELIIIPKTFLPIIIDNFVFNKLSDTSQKIVRSSYFELPDGRYRLDTRKIISNNDIVTLAFETQIRKGKVVWCEFGFNIGEEFGGPHPALIIKEFSNSIIVLPLSSGTSPYSDKTYIIDIPKIYGAFDQIPRWTNIQRLRLVSIKRINFNTKVGSVKKDVLDKIRAAIIKEFN